MSGNFNKCYLCLLFFVLKDLDGWGKEKLKDYILLVFTFLQRCLAKLLRYKTCLVLKIYKNILSFTYIPD